MWLINHAFLRGHYFGSIYNNDEIKIRKFDRLGKFGFIEINTSGSTYKELINERPDFVCALQSLDGILNGFYVLSSEI